MAARYAPDPPRTPSDPDWEDCLSRRFDLECRAWSAHRLRSRSPIHRRYFRRSPSFHPYHYDLRELISPRRSPSFELTRYRHPSRGLSESSSFRRTSRSPTPRRLHPRGLLRTPSPSRQRLRSSSPIRDNQLYFRRGSNEFHASRISRRDQHLRHLPDIQHRKTKWNPYYDNFEVYDCFGKPHEDKRVTRVLFVGNLERHVTEEDIEKRFSKFGPLDGIHINREGRSKTVMFAFVNFRNILDAFNAKEKMHRCLDFGKYPLSVGYGKIKPSCNLWVGNIPKAVDLNMLFSELDRFGLIKRLDYYEGWNEAIVSYESLLAAEAAWEELRGYLLPATQEEKDLRSQIRKRPIPSSHGLLTDFEYMYGSKYFTHSHGSKLSSDCWDDEDYPARKSLDEDSSHIQISDKIIETNAEKQEEYYYQSYYYIETNELSPMSPTQDFTSVCDEDAGAFSFERGETEEQFPSYEEVNEDKESENEGDINNRDPRIRSSISWREDKTRAQLVTIDANNNDGISHGKRSSLEFDEKEADFMNEWHISIGQKRKKQPNLPTNDSL